MDPLESKSLIENTSIDGTEAVNLIRGKETESTETVLDSNTDERVVVGFNDGLQILLTITKSIATTMDPDKYRKVCCVLGSIDV